jgi:hypothetical protein
MSSFFIKNQENTQQNNISYFYGNWPGKVVRIEWTKTAKSINGG